MKNYIPNDYNKPIFTLDGIIEEYFSEMDEKVKKKNLKFQKLLFKAKNKGINDRISMERFLNNHGKQIDAWKVLNSQFIYFTSTQKKEILQGNKEIGILECDRLDLNDILVIASDLEDNDGFDLISLISGIKIEVNRELAVEA